MDLYASWDIRNKFPNLSKSNSSITSPTDSNYNCIAWAAGDSEAWWDPNRYWPEESPRAMTLEAYISAYESIGYVTCENGKPEKNYEKIVIYTAPMTGRPTHAARLLKNGKWTSKLGASHDISHDTPEVLNGPEYGAPSQYMKRIKK